MRRRGPDSLGPTRLRSELSSRLRRRGSLRALLPPRRGSGNSLDATAGVLAGVDEVLHLRTDAGSIGVCVTKATGADCEDRKSECGQRRVGRDAPKRSRTSCRTGSYQSLRPASAGTKRTARRRLPETSYRPSGVAGHAHVRPTPSHAALRHPMSRPMAKLHQDLRSENQRRMPQGLRRSLQGVWDKVLRTIGDGINHA